MPPMTAPPGAAPPSLGLSPAGGFYLVQGAVGEIGMVLPTPDAAGTLSFASGSGRIALVAAAAPLTCADDPACATAPAVIDFVGYSPGAVSFEGTAAARTPGVERALLRDAAPRMGEPAHGSRSECGPCRGPSGLAP